MPEQSIAVLQGAPAGSQRLEDEAAGGWECVAASVEALQVLVSDLRSTGCDEDAALAALVRSLSAEGLAILRGIWCFLHPAATNGTAVWVGGTQSMTQSMRDVQYAMCIALPMS